MGKLSIRSGAALLTSAARAVGAASALLPASMNYWPAKIQAERKAALSEAGRQGAIVRNQQYQKLKKWALGKAAGMRGTPREISRILSGQLPEHLANASTDPQRLIYETLLASRKKN